MISESVKVVMDAEQAAAADLEKAKEDAKTIISDANADGERIKAEAAKKAAAAAREKTDAAKAKAEEIAAQGEKATATDVAALKAAVEARIPEAKTAAARVFME